MAGRKKIGRLVLSLFILFVFIIIALTGIGSDTFDVHKMRDFIHGSGQLAPLIFSFVFLLIIFMGMPPTLMTVSSGVLFGPYFGLILSTICVNLGGLVLFVAARKIGRKGLQQILSTRLEKLDSRLEQHGLLTVILARLSFVPFGLVCISAALSSIRKRDFLTGTLIGTFPAIFMLSWLGDAAIQMFETRDFSVLLQWQGIVSMLLFASAFAFPVLYEKYRVK